MSTLRNRGEAEQSRNRKVALFACAGLVVALGVRGTIRGADEPAPTPPELFKQYCFTCHGKAATAGIDLDQLTSHFSVADNFAQWEKVVGALEQNRMPPKGMPAPGEDERKQAIAWVHAQLTAYAKKHDGEPGHITVRRLTSGEYNYAIQDLTGMDVDTGIDATTDSVGGEGFSNFGDVQFMQDASLERYLESAKAIANRAVIGTGPLEFYREPGKSGFEMSAINRIKQIYTAQGFRTVSGEGGFPFGLDLYGKAFYVAWYFQNRAKLGEPTVTIKDLANREQVSPRFAKHILTVMNSTLSYPSNEVQARWHKLPAPGADPKAATAAARTGCAEIQKFVTLWPSWLFSRGDKAAGGAGDESPLVINDASLKVDASHHFNYNRGGRGGFGAGGRGAAPAGPAKVFLNITQINPTAKGKPVIIWKNPTIAFSAAPQRGGGATPPANGVTEGAGAAFAAAQAAGSGRGRGPAAPKVPLRSVVSEETAKKLGFGQSLDGSPVGPDDFASEASVSFEVPMPQGMAVFQFQVDATLGADRDQVFRIMITDREDGTSRGIPVRTLLGDPQSAGFRTFKAGVMELARLLPPNAFNEPTPADKDPIPLPFDSTYNVPEHDAFDTRVKYIRDDQFIYQNMLDDATRARVDHAWNDLKASFGYHQSYVELLAEHYKIDLKGKTVAQLDKATLDAMPEDARKYIAPVVAEYKKVIAAQAVARPHHLEDSLQLATRAWRRPLTEKEKLSLRAFYDKTMTAEADHDKAIRALITRILVSPEFLYRVEQPAELASFQPLSNWEMASRLSFFLWSSIPDDELRRAAAAGELTSAPQVQKQVKRMLADAKARRMATEFFGQWLGFYNFDEHKGVDTTRYPEFTNEVKEAMYDEAVSFFDYIIRKDRPVREILSADYTFLNEPLAKFYGVKKEVKSKTDLEFVEGANAIQRGGLLRLGAVLTTTSAPLRTSPVKRGDWVLRRILGIAVPPPPADAGSIPADDKLFGGLSLREKLEQHKRNATCANCHLRIDPLGFPLEHYDSMGRYREKYADGKAIWDTGTFADKTEVDGVNGLVEYLKGKEPQVLKTMARKMIGYALGRTVLPSDQILVDRMVSRGGDASFEQLAADIATSKQFLNRPTRDTTTTKPMTVAAVRNTQKAGGQ